MYDMPEPNSFYQSLVWTVARRGPEEVVYYGGVLDVQTMGAVLLTLVGLVKGSALALAACF